MSNLAIDDFDMRPKCGGCGAILRGRFDKRFCNNTCRMRHLRDVKKIEDHAGPLADALEKNRAAKYIFNIGEICPLQAEIIRHAHVINEILMRKAHNDSAVYFSVWDNFYNGIKNCVYGWQCDFGQDEERFNTSTLHEEQVIALLDEFTNPFNHEEWK